MKMNELRSYLGLFSGPFHPFGGAVDILVVEQEDGSFKSSPWYVCFGKFQGVLKTREKVVNISVNGAEADFQMYLDHKGQAYFLQEVDVEEGDSLFSPSSSGEDMEEKFPNKRTMKSKSYNYDAGPSNLATQMDVTNGNAIPRTNSRRSRFFGFVMGRTSMKENRPLEGDLDSGVIRTESLERAEIAADLLELNWSTNLPSNRHMRNSIPPKSAKDIPKSGTSQELHRTDGCSNTDSLKIYQSVSDNGGRVTDLHLSEKQANFNHELDTFPCSGFSDLKTASCPEISCSASERVTEKSSPAESGKDDTSHASFYSETSNYSSTGLYSPTREANKICESCNCDHTKILHATTEVMARVNSQAEPVSVTKEFINIPESLRDGSLIAFLEEKDFENDGISSEVAHVNSQIETVSVTKELLNLEGSLDKPFVDFVPSGMVTNNYTTENYSQMVNIDPLNSSVDELETQRMSFSSTKNSTCQSHESVYLIGKDQISNHSPAMHHGDDPESTQECHFPKDIPPSESSEEEQAVFGDLDDFKRSELKNAENIGYDYEEDEVQSSFSSRGTGGKSESPGPSFMHDYVPENLPYDSRDSEIELKTISSDINVPHYNNAQYEIVARMARSLPNMHHLNGEGHDHSFSHSLNSSPKMLKRMKPVKDVSTTTQFGVYPSQLQTTIDNVNISETMKGKPSYTTAGDSSRFDPSKGTGRSWSFFFKRSASMKATPLNLDFTDSINAKDTLNKDKENDMSKTKENKKKIRVNTPTSVQLASLKLKEGKNEVIFTFSTPMLGKQQVDARIFLWRWDARIVISDVDGTITRSDLLGQVMPLVGVDWSQTGVAHLFSAIKENGFQFLFLSARAISQANNTRQFLFNLKQDGKVLPEGPVLISPDGLFPSLFREVIRRAPHEFKISCLEDIRALFPADRNPFYAGFGNRDTDEISYLKVGIPKGKIFIINPKGEVVVHRRVDSKSYTSLHDLVNSMFPSMPSSEQEDFNLWNFWKLPPPSLKP